MLLPRRGLLAVAAVVDVALHARPHPVAAKSLAERLGLPPRYLEPLLQALVRADILRGMRGPRGGYELARERRRITVAAVLRAIQAVDADDTADVPAIVRDVVAPAVARADDLFLAELDQITMDDMCRSAEHCQATRRMASGADFTI